MSLTSSQVSVTSSATPLSTAGGGTGRGNASVTVSNPVGGQTVYLGPASVSTSSYRLVGGKDISVDLPPGELLYGIVASSTQTVDVLQTGA